MSSKRINCIGSAFANLFIKIGFVFDGTVIIHDIQAKIESPCSIHWLLYPWWRLFVYHWNWAIRVNCYASRPSRRTTCIRRWPITSLNLILWKIKSILNMTETCQRLFWFIHIFVRFVEFLLHLSLLHHFVIFFNLIHFFIFFKFE